MRHRRQKLTSCLRNFTLTDVIFSGNAAYSQSGTHVTMTVPTVMNRSGNATSGALEAVLMFSTTPYNGGALNGYQVAALPYSTQLGPGGSLGGYEITTNFYAPPDGTYYASLLLEEFNNGWAVDNYINLPAVTQVSASAGNGLAPVSFAGVTSYQPSGNSVALNVPNITNASTSLTTGALRVALWYTATPYVSGTINGFMSASVASSALAPSGLATAVSTTASYTAPPAQDTAAVLTLEEYNGNSYVVMDHINYPAAGTAVLAANNFTVQDVTAGTLANVAGDQYSGPVANLQYQYVSITPHSLNISARAPNAFIHSGAGVDALDVSGVGGTNVLDGGTNSNFLVGGKGATSHDTFFVDDRSPGADIWSSVANFHAGDAATIWGVTPQNATISWADGQGAQGYTGLTMHATAAGQPTASITIAGYSTADLASGKLSASFGNVSGTPYLYIH